MKKAKTSWVWIALTDTEKKRVDRIAEATNRSRANLLKRIIEDAITGPDAEQVLKEKHG